MIDRLNEKTCKKFRQGIKEMARCESAETRGKLDWGNSLCCEDPRLSLAGPGHQFWAIDLKRCKTPLETIDPDELENMLDILASGLDLENPKYPPGPAAFSRRNEFYASKAFKESRADRIFRASL